MLAPHIMNHFSPYYTDIFEANYPFSVKPERKVTAQDFMAIHRDYYGENPWFPGSESTEFDMTKGLAAGPFGSPTRLLPGKGESAI